MSQRLQRNEALRQLAPLIPDHEREAILDHAEDSIELRNASPETAVWLSMTAYIRHTFTDYDELMDEGYDQESARHFVLADMNEVLRVWGCKRQISEEE
jgi:hypothetical protein